MKKNNLKSHSVIITNDKIHQRIDNFLIRYLKNIPKNKIYCIIRNGKIRVNKKRIDHKYRLQYKDIIHIPLLEQKKTKKIKLPKNINIKKFILYEDDLLIILNKPSGIAVHGGSGLIYGIIEILRLSYIKYSNLELVHRLDKETSGVLLISKKNYMLRELHSLLKDKKIKKNYFALVSGYWPSSIKEVTVPLLKVFSKSKKHVVKIDTKYGKYSKTTFKIIERFMKFATLIKVVPITGRTHQIRVHTKYVGHPIICDNRYGNKDCNNIVKNFGFNRLFLHAYSLSFKYPNSNKILSIKAPLDEELVKILKILRIYFKKH
ncbi:MAG: 23S rRNA pseudouridine(955/2504/2580) synthase [Candidatus Westeberhardia cardiocondylae]|nr:23S rRNA pseudouridine(955/2504/2580) synthase [Candidatus Westeberhardia cardiocondylae]